MIRDDNKYYMALNMIENANMNALHSLCKKVDHVKELFEQPHLDKLEKAERTILKKIHLNKKQYLSLAEKELEEIKRDGAIDIITFEDKNYPELLKKISDPPLLLYVKGEIPKEQNIAVVGSRDSSPYGNKIAWVLSKDLAENDFTIISGLAMGIDTQAHKGAIDGQGKTVAVLGSGLKWIYPEENKELYSIIHQNGAIISEFPLHQKPDRFNFPRRNRIISGLSLGTVVIEAGNRSGALITASFALEQGREVFAVPGPISDRMSEGTNRLIKQGAKLVQDIDDILEELNFHKTKKRVLFSSKKEENKKREELTQEEKKILDLMNVEPINVDIICDKTKIKINHLERILMLLEIKGYVEQVPGHKFRLLE